MKIAIFAAAMSAAICGCATTANQAALNDGAYDPDRIKAHMTFLADDSLKGREPFSPEYKIAANYVASQFAEAGLQPSGDDGTYFQQVPFREYSIRHDKAEAVITTMADDGNANEQKVFAFQSTRMGNEAFSGELVFVGYGLEVPSKGINDYAGLDLEGKVAVIASTLPDGLNYDERTYHRSAGRYKAADERGAVGVIWLSAPQNYDDASDRRKKSFIEEAMKDEGIATAYEELSEEVKRGLYKKQVKAREQKRATSNEPQKITRWVTPDGERQDLYPNIKGAFTIQNGALADVFSNSGLSYSDVLESISDKAPLKGVALKGAISLKTYTEQSDLKYSANVIGLLPGADPVLKNEYVIVTGHLDHLGVRGDEIMNGALDNAAGISIMIEVAQALKEKGVSPKRSILFTAVTAEEMGLQGAYYFVNFPTIDKTSIVANVNIDMPLIVDDFSEIVGFGAEHSSLGPALERAARTAGMTLIPDPVPEMNIFTRSDHYAFVRQGIPAVFPFLGFELSDDGEGGGEVFEAFMQNDYHSPTDDLSRDIRYDIGATFAQIVAETLLEAANGDRPRWNEGNFYKETYCDGSC